MDRNGRTATVVITIVTALAWLLAAVTSLAWVIAVVADMNGRVADVRDFEPKRHEPQRIRRLRGLPERPGDYPSQQRDGGNDVGRGAREPVHRAAWTPPPHGQMNSIFLIS